MGQLTILYMAQAGPRPLLMVHGALGPHGAHAIPTVEIPETELVTTQLHYLEEAPVWGRP